MSNNEPGTSLVPTQNPELSIANDPTLESSLESNAMFREAINTVQERREEYTRSIMIEKRERDQSLEILNARKVSIVGRVNLYKTQIEKNREEVEEARALVDYNTDREFETRMFDYKTKAETVEMAALNCLLVNKQLLFDELKDRFGLRVVEKEDLLNVISELVLSRSNLTLDAENWLEDKGQSTGARFLQEEGLRFINAFRESGIIVKDYSGKKRFGLVENVHVGCGLDFNEDFKAVLGHLGIDKRLEKKCPLSCLVKKLEEAAKLFKRKKSAAWETEKQPDSHKEVIRNIARYLLDIDIPFETVDLSSETERRRLYIALVDSFVGERESILKKNLAKNKVICEDEEQKRKLDECENELREVVREIEECSSRELTPYYELPEVRELKIIDPEKSEKLTTLILLEARKSMLENFYDISGKSSAATDSEYRFLKTMLDFDEKLMAFIDEHNKLCQEWWLSRFLSRRAAQGELQKDVKTQNQDSGEIPGFIEDFYADLLAAYELFKAGETLFTKSFVETDINLGEALMTYANSMITELERKMIFFEVQCQTANISELEHERVEFPNLNSPGSLAGVGRFIEEQGILRDLDDSDKLESFERRLEEELEA